MTVHNAEALDAMNEQYTSDYIRGYNEARSYRFAGAFEPATVARLRRPFAAVKFLPQGKANDQMKGVRCLAYIDSSLVVERLSEVDPSWQATYTRLADTFADWKASGYATECTVTVQGVARTDIGYAATGIEPMKAAYSDALKRAALRHGVGSFLRDDSWAFWLPRSVQDANGRTHDAFSVYTGANGKPQVQMKPAGRAYLRAEYRKVLAQASFAAHYGEPVEYGDVDEVLDQSAPEDADDGASVEGPDVLDAAQVDVLVLLATYTGRKTGEDAYRRRFGGDGVVFERSLAQVLTAVQGALALDAAAVEAVRAWAIEAGTGDTASFDALADGLAEWKTTTTTGADA